MTRSTQKLCPPVAGAAATYPNLTPCLSKPIEWDLIRTQYDEMVRYATGLHERTADAEAILRRFTRSNAQHPTYRALAELTNRLEDQEVAMLTMHLLQSCLVYVNTLMIQRVLDETKWRKRMTDADMRVLSPLVYAHVNLLGRYHFALPDSVLRGELRPLRDPNDPEEILNASAASA